MIKKFFSVLISLLTLISISGCNIFSGGGFADNDLGVNGFPALPACGAAQINSTTSFLPSQGNGTASNPYIICNVFQLQLMGNVDFEGNVNIIAGNETLNGFFELGADIDASETSTWTGGANGDGFIPMVSSVGT